MDLPVDTAWEKIERVALHNHKAALETQYQRRVEFMRSAVTQHSKQN